MEISNLNNLYKQIANKVNKMIPVSWEKVYLYGEVTNKSTKIFFFFRPNEDINSYIYFSEIPKVYKIGGGMFTDHILELHSLFTKLYWEYKRGTIDMWTNITIEFSTKNDFKVDLDYTNLKDCNEIERKAIWKYKYLGIKPEDKDTR